MALTTTRVYKSTDAGAPVLTGQVGTAIAVLKACLVGTAGVAYGTGGDAKPAAGWTEEFTGTNKSALRNSLAAGGSGCYLRIDDRGALGGGALNTFFKVYRTMSGIDTGLDVAPNPASSPNGEYMRKSTSADSTARPWIVVADERTVYMLMLPNVTTFAGAWNAADGLMWAGDFDSLIPGDAYAYGIAARVGKTPTDMGNGGSGVLYPSSDALVASNPGGTIVTNIWLARNHAAAAGSIIANLMTPWVQNPGGNALCIGGLGSVMGNPAPGSGLEFWIPSYVVHSGLIRGRMRGVFSPLCDMSAVISGTVRTSLPGLPVGTELMILRASCPGGVNVPQSGSLGVDVGDSW